MPGYSQPGQSIDPGFSRQGPYQDPDPGFSRPLPGPGPVPAYPQPNGSEPAVHDLFFRGPPQPGFPQAVPLQPYARPVMADPRVAEQMRRREMAARWEASQDAMPGVLKERAQRAWDQRRRGGKARAKRELKARR